MEGNLEEGGRKGEEGRKDGRKEKESRKERRKGGLNIPTGCVFCAEYSYRLNIVYWNIHTS